MIDRAKLAGYIDEAGDDPQQGIETLLQHGIRSACIRQLWTGNVMDVADHAVRRAKVLLDGAGIAVPMLATDLGNVPAEELSSVPSETLDRAFNLANFFGAGFIRVRCGRAGSETDPHNLVLKWMTDIQDRSIRAGVVPLLELSWDQAVYEPAAAARLLAALPRWKLLYDPAQLCMQRRIDPFVKYWTLLKSRVAAIDLHDVKIGHNFRPVGQGDCNWPITLRDAAESKYTGWYFLEPGMGRRYGQALTRRDTFALAMEALGMLENA